MSRPRVRQHKYLFLIPMLFSNTCKSTFVAPALPGWRITKLTRIIRTCAPHELMAANNVRLVYGSYTKHDRWGQETAERNPRQTIMFGAMTVGRSRRLVARENLWIGIYCLRRSVWAGALTWRSSKPAGCIPRCCSPTSHENIRWEHVCGACQNWERTEISVTPLPALDLRERPIRLQKYLACSLQW